MNSTLIEQKLLEENKHLCVVKSVSKSYGVPGLRLGVLASGNTEIIEKLKKDVAIWNINSFGEFYMQIYEKYKGDYEESLTKIRKERARFFKNLEKINGIRVIPSQANYIMIELINGMTAKDFTKAMLIKYNMLIKDLSKKTNGKQYVRLAVRNTEDNDKLTKAIKESI